MPHIDVKRQPAFLHGSFIFTPWLHGAERRYNIWTIIRIVVHNYIANICIASQDNLVGILAEKGEVVWCTAACAAYQRGVIT